MSRYFLRAPMTRTSLALTSLLLLSGILAAAPNNEPAELSYRLIFAPIEQILQLTKDELRAVKRDQFDAWIQADIGTPQSIAAGVSIVRADYQATFDGNFLINGTANLNISANPSRLTSLSLEPLNLAIRKPTWHREPDRAAELGIQADGRLSVNVGTSDTLHFDWTLAPTEIENGETIFRLQLPRCPINRLRLTLPSSHSLQTDVGVVSQLTETRSNGTVLWQVNGGGHAEIVLRLRSNEAPKPLPLIRQANRYTISEQGIELNAELHLDSEETPIHELQLKLTADLQLTRVRSGKQPVSWTVAAGGKSEPTTVLLTLDPPLQGLNQVLSLTCFAPYQEQTIGKLRSLPRVEVSETQWQQELVRIRIQRPLVLEDMQLENAHQFQPSQVEAEGDRELVNICFVEPSAKIMVQFAHAPQQIIFDQGTSIEVTANEAIADVALRLRSASSDIFKFKTIVQPGWTVDSVDSDQPDSIHDWRIPTASSSQQEPLNIDLRKPITLKSDSIIRIRARRRLNATDQTFSETDFRPIELPQQQARRRFLTMQTSDDLLVQYDRDRRVTWLTLDDLDAIEAGLVEANEESAIMLLNDNHQDLSISFNPLAQNKRPFHADLEITSQVTNRSVRERIRIQIDRTTPPLAVLKLHFASPAEAPIRWFPALDPQRTLSSQQKTDEHGETWNVEWPEPSDEQIVVIGEREFPTSPDGKLNLPLVRVAGATTQQGVIRIEAPGQILLSFDGSDLLTPTPIQRQDYRQLSRQRRSYRYNPLADIFAEDPPQVSIALSDESSHRAFARQTTHSTQIDRTGISRHQFSVALENQAASELNVTLPDAVGIRHVYVDGRKLAFPPTSDRELAIPLPPNRRFLTVQLEYEEIGSPLGRWQQIRLSPPKLDVPILAKRWQLWTPPEYVAPAPIGSHESLMETCLSRLFGPFLRASHQPPFNLFARRSWAELWNSATRKTELSPVAIRWIEQIGATSTLTWEDAVAESDKTSQWIDATRLVANGIAPNQPVPAGNAATAYERGIRRLQTAKLLLLQTNNSVILTSAEFLSEFPTQLRRTSCPVILESNLRIPEKSPTAQSMPWIELSRPKDWLDPPEPWVPIVRSDAPFVAGGWQLRRINPTRTQTQIIYHRSSFVIAACLAFIMAVAFAWWIRSVDTKLAITTLLISTMLVFLLPTPLHWIGLGAFWGTLTGFFLTPAIGTARQRKLSSLTPSRQKTNTIAIGILLVIATGAAGFISQTAEGQETEGDKVRASKTYQLFVPSDRAGKPTGDYILIPKTLHNQLQSANTISNLDPLLVQSAVYRANPMRLNGATEPLVDTVLAEYRLLVTAAGSTIGLQLPAESAALLEREGRLNGRPIQLEWNRAQSAVILPIRDAGVHQLSMTFRIPNSGPTTSVDLPIPRAMNSTLRLSAPEDLTFLQSDSAIGETSRDESTGDWQIEFGSAKRLQFRWAAEPSSVNPMIEQISWLMIKPDQVTWDTRLIVDTRLWPSNLLQVEVDARLRLDPIKSDQPLAYNSAAKDGIRVLEFAIDREDEAPQSIQLNFILAGWPGMGRLDLPKFRILGAKRIPHDLGVSFDARLAGKPIISGGTDRLQTSPFSIRWGAETPPNFAFRLDENNPNWSCSTKLIEPTTEANTQIGYGLAADATDVVFLADITTINGPQFQQQIQLAKDIEVQSVTQIEGNKRQKLRWAKNSPQEMTVFLDPTISSDYQLAIIGRQTNQTLGLRDLPPINLLGCVLNSKQLLVFRRSDVLVSLPDTDSSAEPPTISPLITDQLGLSRWYTNLSLAGEEVAPKIQVRENEQQLKAELTNIVTRKDGAWQHEVKVSCQVDQGYLDALRFEIPAAWTSVFDNPDLGVKVELKKSPRSGMARVTLWPTENFDQMTLAGAIPTTPGQPLKIPNIRLLEDGAINRTLYLPTRVDDQSVLWSTTNLEAQEISANVMADLDQPANYVGYQITQDEFQATRLPARTEVSAPKVHLTDVRATITENDQYWGQAIFDLQPGGIRQCLVRSPDQLKIVSVSAEDVFIDLPSNTTDAGVLVELMSSELPQRIWVVFTGKIQPHPPTKDRTVHAPTLCRVRGEDENTEIEVRQTLWTLQATPPGEIVRFIDQKHALSRPTMQLKRLSHLAEMIDVASQVATDFTPDELTQWYTAWGERYGASLRRLQLIQAKQGELRPTDLNKIQQRQLDATEVLEVAETSEQLANRMDVIDSIEVWNIANPYRTRERFATIEGASNSLRFNYSPHDHQSPQTRIAIICLLGLIGFGFLPRIHHSYLEDVRWIYFFGVLAGLAWWLWLQPSVVGWFIVAASLIAMRLLRWPSTRIQEKHLG